VDYFSNGFHEAGELVSGRMAGTVLCASSTGKNLIVPSLDCFTVASYSTE
jgi:hypothetical protein